MQNSHVSAGVACSFKVYSSTLQFTFICTLAGMCCCNTQQSFLRQNVAIIPCVFDIIIIMTQYTSVPLSARLGMPESKIGEHIMFISLCEVISL